MVIITIEMGGGKRHSSKKYFCTFTAEDDLDTVLDSQKVQQKNGATNVYTNVSALTDASRTCMGSRNCFRMS